MIRNLLFAATMLPVFTGALAVADERKMTVYKTPTCGCCAAWVNHVKAAGFDVDVKDMDDLTSIKQMAGVPANLQACHTATIDGHTIEGHVPAHAIEAFLQSGSTARGISVPGMPQGSPGMPSPRPEVYDVVAFGNGAPTLVGRYREETPNLD